MTEFDWTAVTNNLPFLMQGLFLTFQLTILAMVGGILLGTVLAILRLSAPAPVPQLIAGYVNGLRAMPLILVIFWFYLLVPLALGRPVGAFPSALIAFTLFEAAYYSEIIRAGIQGVARGQLQAALASGLSYAQAMRYIVLPQAFRAMLPILLTQSIILFQDTSLVYVVGLRDFLTAANIVASRDQRPVEMYLFIAAVYLVLCAGGSFAVRRLQRRLAR
ncbi:MAG: ABC transporter permease subunit [Alphaproteobacteria bacterium]|nr:ABC transporter permease subunit [Alphaproteobacteria bacterium]TAD88131.1 MAG: ABC transporter permease subunit [Alphaproteobacteria bacterium]